MKNIVVLASGSGTNLQRIIDCTKSGEISNAEISLVVADRDCYAIQRSEKEAIRNVIIPRGKDFSRNLQDIIPEDTDLIVLAGFLSILSKQFAEKYQGKIINIHPALLPKFGGKGMWGMNVHNAVLQAKETESGATVHFVTHEIDGGEIILQQKIKVDKDETPESLAEKIHEVEYRLLPKAINKILNHHG